MDPSARALGLLASELPDLEIRSAAPREEGWDSFVLEINEEWIFRFPRRPEIVQNLLKEAALLPRIAPLLSVLTPRFEYISLDPAHWSESFVGYRKIPGIGLYGNLRSSLALAGEIGSFLSELHAIPPAVSGLPTAAAQDWREEYIRFFASVQEEIFPHLSTTAQAYTHRFWVGYLEDPANFAFTPVLIHRDLCDDHLICDPDRGHLVGVIDWEDATYGDPALDFVGLNYIAGRSFVEQALACYRGEVDGTFWGRIEFLTRVIPYHQTGYGLEIDSAEHLEAGLSAIETAACQE